MLNFSQDQMQSLLLALFATATAWPSSKFVNLGHRRINHAWDQADDPFQFSVDWPHSIWPRNVIEELTETTLPGGGRIKWYKDAHLQDLSCTFRGLTDASDRCLPREQGGVSGWDTFFITFDRAEFERPFKTFESVPIASLVKRPSGFVYNTTFSGGVIGGR
jgi:hypothetical protein